MAELSDSGIFGAVEDLSARRGRYLLEGDPDGRSVTGFFLLCRAKWGKWISAGRYRVALRINTAFTAFTPSEPRPCLRGRMSLRRLGGGNPSAEVPP